MDGNDISIYNQIKKILIEIEKYVTHLYLNIFTNNKEYLYYILHDNLLISTGPYSTSNIILMLNKNEINLKTKIRFIDYYVYKEKYMEFFDLENILDKDFIFNIELYKRII